MESQVTRYRNVAEQAFVKQAKSEGWEVTKRGWPDFFCKKGDRVMCVEVKPEKKDGSRKALRVNQIHRMEWLQSLGVECYVGIGGELVPFVADDEWYPYYSLQGTHIYAGAKVKYEEAII